VQQNQVKLLHQTPNLDFFMLNRIDTLIFVCKPQKTAKHAAEVGKNTHFAPLCTPFAQQHKTQKRKKATKVVKI